MDDVCKNQLIIKLNLKFPMMASYEYVCAYNYKYHKLNGPAVIYHDGYKKWYNNNKRYNIIDEDCKNQLVMELTLFNDNQFTVGFSIGCQFFRLDGPASIYKTGDKKWLVNDHGHRNDGPAFIFKNGEKEWWVNDELINESIVN